MEDDNLDYVTACVDEIALEGLDGITLTVLWLRLEKRPHFPLPLDEDSKAFIWEVISQHPDIEFYELPEPRKQFTLFNRYDYLDLDIGIVFEPENVPDDIYPYKAIDEKDVRGSCSTFTTRKNITSEIRDDDRGLLTYEEAVERWHDKLVLVASQEQRNLALLGTEVNPHLKLNIIQYCMIERIGRSRYHGEVTQGKNGLTVLGECSKTLYYYRKMLLEKHLITKQVHYERNCKGQTTVGSLLHLKRFYVERKSKIQIILQKMSELLYEKPKQREIFHKLRTELGVKETTFKKVFQKTFNQYFKLDIVPYRQIYPNATDKEAKSQNGNEKILKIVELIKPYDQSEDDDNDKETSNLNETFFNPKNFMIDRPLLSQVFNVIKSEGPKGISAQEIGRTMGIPKLEMRLLCRNLERREVVSTYMQDVGRQRVTKYIAKEYEKDSEIHKKILIERKRILDLSSKNEENSDMDTNNYQVCDVSQTPENNELSFVSIEPEKDDIDNKKKQNVAIASSFTEDLKQMYSEKNKKETSHITYRILKRAGIIIETVKRMKMVDDIYQIQKLIYESEMKEGYNKKIHKKSVLRLIHKLAKDGYVRSIKTILKLGDNVKKLHFVCIPSITVNDPSVKIAIEQAKFKYFASKEMLKPTQLKNDKQSKQIDSIGQSIQELQQLQQKPSEKIKMQYMPSIGRTYGLEPKFIRMKSLYTLLFYLVYDYQGNFSTNIDGPPIYHDEIGWKMFIPPLRQHCGIPEGWCLISDVLLSLPLSLLVKIVNITYKVEGLETFLKDPIKQHYLLRDLPPEIRSALMYNRRYIFSVCEIATKLSFMNLVSFGPQQTKEKDHSFLYVHRYASIKDTTISKTGYLYISDDMDYSIRKYYLKTLEDVESYWLHLETVCLHTPLGYYNTARGQSINIENIYRKPMMIEACRNKEFSEIVDDGSLLGDGRGAAGLDSGFFAHLKRNWSWPSMQHHLHHNIEKLCQKDTDVNLTANTNYMQYLLHGSDSSSQKVSERRFFRLKNIKRKMSDTVENDAKSISKNELKEKNLKRKQPVNQSVPYARKRSKPDKIIRNVTRILKRKRKPYYDDKDKDALKKMSKLRVLWTAQEDSILLMCKVASYLLDPNYNRMVVPYTCVRDVLHEKLPNLSNNKTSRACQRRVGYMLMNPTTVQNVSVFLCEAQQDKELVNLYLGPKPPKTHEETWANMFVTLLNQLLKKFTQSSSERCEKIILPKTIEQLQQDYQMIISGELPDYKSKHEDVKTIANIQESVVHSLIMSSLWTSGDKNNWNYVLYKLYQQYPMQMLQNAVTCIRQNQIATKKKCFSKKSYSNLPLSTIPYRLSVNYYNSLRTPFQVEIYCEVYSLLDKLINKDKSSIGVNVYTNVISGYSAAVVSLMAKFLLTFELHIPNQIILLDTSLSDRQRSEVAKKMKEMESTEYMNNDNQVKSNVRSENSDILEEPPQKKRMLDNDVEQNQSDDHDYSSLPKTDNDTNLNSNVSFEVSSSTKASRLALFMLRQSEDNKQKNKILHSQDYFVINSCNVFCRLRNENSQFLKSNIIYDIIDSQRKYLPINEIPSFKILSDSSEFEVNEKEFGRKIFDTINEQKELGITEDMLENFRHLDETGKLEKILNFMLENWIIIRVGTSCFRYVSYQYSKPWILSSLKIPKENKLLCRIEYLEKTTSDNANLDTDNSSNKISDVEKTLAISSKKDEGKIQANDSVALNLSTGSTEENQSSEIIETTPKDSSIENNSISSSVSSERGKRTCKQQSDFSYKSVLPEKKLWENVQFIGRTWRKPDGSLNHPTLNKLLSSILGHIMANPGITVSQLCKYFKLSLFPVEVLELLEMLEKAECIQRYYLKPSHSVTLFSKPIDYTLTEKKNLHSKCHIEIFPDAIIKFSQLSEMLLNKRGLKNVKYN
ncbi:general transcription factor 3C polypeptide 1 [Centruroides vittatus]|uniref:general transcription factor 3C polypeptide 1 n=1 Tax=Centruroides vittatus TaxID=120091 RepID=UPI00350F50E4